MNHALVTLREEPGRIGMGREAALRLLLAAYERKLADAAFPDAPALAGIARTRAALRRVEDQNRRAA